MKEARDNRGKLENSKSFLWYVLIRSVPRV
jgi:hypothetical protein